ncbi:MAG: hypothetical protein EOM06_09585 [Sphingobacteriia bacterium]|nr:hypothetical protein [Sphingobacteriia bacterium]
MQTKRFKQVKTAYGLDRIISRMMETSESMIASIILVLNLVRLAGVGALCLLLKYFESYSARYLENSILLQPARVSNKNIFDIFNNTKPVAA